MTREEKIERIIRDIDSWDIENLRDFARYETRVRLEKLSNSDVQKEFEDTILGTEPTCGHSACRQNWVDTGDGSCVVKEPVASDVEMYEMLLAWMDYSFHEVSYDFYSLTDKEKHIFKDVETFLALKQRLEQLRSEKRAEKPL